MVYFDRSGEGKAGEARGTGEAGGQGETHIETCFKVSEEAKLLLPALPLPPLPQTATGVSNLMLEKPYSVTTVSPDWSSLMTRRVRM